MLAPDVTGESPRLSQASYTVLTPYLVPPGPKRINVGDGFILDSAIKLIGAPPAAAFSSRVPLSDEDIERINASRMLVAAGANTLKDDFELAPGFGLETLERIRVPVVLLGVGHYGVAQVTQGLGRSAQALFAALLERFPRVSVRCDASRRYLLQGLPGSEDRVVMTSCPVVHAVDGIDRGFARKAVYEQLVVTLTDRAFLEAQLPLLPSAAAAFPARRRVLALHQDYGNAQLEAYARGLGYEVFRARAFEPFLRLYESTDIHVGNRVHAHLKCLSLGVRSFCTPFDLRQVFFAQSLDYPLLERMPDPAVFDYDFARVVRRRNEARARMDAFVAALRAVIDA